MMVGMTLGMQGMQTIQSIRERSVGETASYQDAFIVGAVIAVVATALAFAVRSMHRPGRPGHVGSPEAAHVAEPVR